MLAGEAADGIGTREPGLDEGLHLEAVLLGVAGEGVLERGGAADQVQAALPVGGLLDQEEFRVAPRHGVHRVDVPQLGVARWCDSIRFDAASGASSTVQVELFDATSTATATTPFATFTVCTNTTNTNASAGTTGALMQGGNALLLLNYKINNRLFIAAAGNNPDSITGTVSVDNTRPTNPPSR